jgi:protease-4
VAASGGYYISCGADRIFADPNTITGSIGVFGMIPHIGDLYEKHLGITFDRVKTNEYADLMTPTRKLRKKERALIEEQIDSVYQQFLRRVADGRDMEKSEVDSIARGRVWSGKDAERIGLVDELGGMEDAVAHAEEQVEADDLEQVAYPERKDPFQRFMDDLNMNVKEKVLNSTLGSDMRFYRKYRYVRSVLDMEGVQMRMPYHIEVR